MTAHVSNTRTVHSAPAAARKGPGTVGFALAALLAAFVPLACGSNTSGPPIINPTERDCGADLNLGVGESTILDPTSAGECEFFLPSASSARYRVGIVWASGVSSSASESAVLTVTRRGANAQAPDGGAGGGIARAPQERLSPGIEGDRRPSVRIPEEVLRRDLARLEATERVHERLRRADAELVARMGRDALLPDRTGRVAFAPTAAEAPLEREFYEATTSCDLEGVETIQAELIHDSDYVSFYQDSGQRDTAAVNAAELEVMANFYADYGKPVIDDYFGGITDVDGNGKVIVLVAPLPDISTNAAAFVLSRDFFTPTQCSASNHAEIIYFHEGVINDMQAGSFQAPATLVHEVKHVSSLYNSIQRDPDGDFQPTWIEEGTADIAGEIASRLAWRADGGPALDERIVGEDFSEQAPGGGITIGNYGLLVRLARMVSTLSSQPNALTVDPVLAEPGHSFYGSSWHFHRFLGDAFRGGPTQEATFFREQNSADSPSGLDFLRSELGTSIGELLESYALATLANGESIEENLPRSFAGYDFPTAAEIFCSPNPIGVYPWPITTVGTSSTGTCSPPGSDPSQETKVLAAPFEDAEFDGPDTEGDPEPEAFLGRGGLRAYEFASDGTGEGIDILVEVGSGAASSAKVVVVRLE